MGSATSVQALAVSEDGCWVAGLGRDAHSQQQLLLWHMGQVRRLGKVIVASCVVRLFTTVWSTHVSPDLCYNVSGFLLEYRVTAEERIAAVYPLTVSFVGCYHAAGRACVDARDCRRLSLRALCAAPGHTPDHCWHGQHPPVASQGDAAC